MVTQIKHRNGLIGTIAFHGILLFLLFVLAFRTPLPLPGEQGILVDFGTSNQGLGSFEPRMSEPAPVQPQQTSSASEQQQTLTQDFEESVALPDRSTVRPSETPRETPRETPQETTAPVEQSQPVERTPDPRAMFPGRGDASSASTSQGEAGGQGNQGSPTGAPNVHVYGEGIEVGGGLAGRGIVGNMPSPTYNVNDHGKVVVEVRVDRDGNVTSARPGVRGSTTENRALYEAAQKAALQTKFARSNVLESTGTITYTFKLQGD